METKAGAFHFEMRVSYADCTLGNHVYYSRYLDFLEVTRGEFHREIGFPLLELQNDNTLFPVIECALKYIKPARYDDVIMIELWVSKLSQVRVEFEYAISRQEALLIKARTEHVCTSTTEKPKRIPEQLAVKLKQYFRKPLAPPKPPFGD
jgi:acyl-CoA thioester hydrolase